MPPRAGQPGWWVLSALLGAVIVVLGASNRLPALPLLDALVHFLMYWALGFCWMRATGNGRWVWAGVAWFSALNTVHQAFVPPHEVTVMTWVFNLAASAWGAYLASRRLVPRRPMHSSVHSPVDSLAVQEPNLPLLDVDFSELPLSAD